MSYYMGDYYPRGDPGFLSFLGKGLKMFGGAIPIVGGAVSAIGERLAATGAKTPGIVKASITSMVPAAAGAAAGSAVTRVMSRGGVGATLMKHPVMSAAGAAGAMVGGGMAAGAALAKHARAAVHAGGKRRRRMNVCNPKALRRAARRLHSFAKHYRKAVGFVSPHPKKGRMYFKSRRKKS